MDPQAESSPREGQYRRLFIALPDSEEVRVRLADVSARLQKAALFTPVRASWVLPENFHITVLFLGRVEEARFRELESKLGAITRGIPPLNVDFRGLGFFPHEKAPKVLWAGVFQPPPAMDTLRAAIEARCGEAGLGPRDEQRFHAHVTLARFKSLKGTADFVKQSASCRHLHFGVCEIGRVELMESHLDPAGARYTVAGVGHFAGGHS
ncbi:RNA 2',3'-cyclic phosphodiesterase [Candidatus Poribacteria bacterium]|nr:RNA 2',3'-cyclic phosphodiesterase [Candidatus Poribacteria bacterium]